MKLKIMTYNIEQGFYKNIGTHDKPRFKYEREREDAAKEIVKQEKPDILVLTEANFIDKNKFGILRDYKKIFKYKYWIKNSEKRYHTPWGVAILSNYPIIEGEDYTIKHIRHIRALIKVGKKRLMVDAVHPAPPMFVDEYNKARWIKTVVRDTKQPYVLLGDFNSMSHFDKYDEKKYLRWLKEKKYKNPREFASNCLNCDTTKYLQKQGLLDSFLKVNKKWEKTCPTNLSNEFPLRIDYIFTSKDVRIIDSKVVKGDNTEIASDHYPLFTIIDI